MREKNSAASVLVAAGHFRGKICKNCVQDISKSFDPIGLKFSGFVYHIYASGFDLELSSMIFFRNFIRNSSFFSIFGPRAWVFNIS